MSTIIDSIVIFILCAALYPVHKWNALFIMCLLLFVSLYLFQYCLSDMKMFRRMCIPALILFFLVPGLIGFIPFYVYVCFYRRQYAIAALFFLPFLTMAVDNPYTSNSAFCFLAALSFYLAFRNNKQARLITDLHAMRDHSIEQQLTLKYANAQLLENQNNQIYIATLKERSRIAREIHDNVGHLLTSSLLQTGALLAVCKNETLLPYVETLKNTLDEAMSSIRHSVHDLHNEAIDMKEVLTQLTEQFTFCPVNLQCSISRQIPTPVKYCFLTIVKEGLNNIARHSNATSAHITVREHPAFYQLTIEDNGTKGSGETQPDINSSSGLGLYSMQERVQALHGTINIQNQKGFRVFISIPKEAFPD